jgi:hypothetical protein
MAGEKTLGFRNGGMWKILLAIATALIATGGIIATIKANCERIKTVEFTAAVNKEATVSLKKDIQRLDEKIIKLDAGQEKMLNLQMEIYREVKK